MKTQNHNNNHIFIFCIILALLGIGFGLNFPSYNFVIKTFTIIFTLFATAFFLFIYRKKRGPSKIYTPKTTVPSAKISPANSLPTENMQKRYPPSSAYFLKMKIVSSNFPPREGYEILSDDEKKFFTVLYEKLIAAKYKPEEIKLTRLGDGTFNVDYVSLCYIGKICLYTPLPTYAVIKKGNSKATKIFAELDQAQAFAAKDCMYEIQTRTAPQNTYMQYLIDDITVKHLYHPSLQQCIDCIPKWIQYLNHCKHQLRSI